MRSRPFYPGRSSSGHAAIGVIAPAVLKCVLALTVVVLGCVYASALQIIPLPIEMLSSNAALVVHGTVSSKSVQRDSAGRIYTKVDLQVQEVWKGNVPTNHLTIVHGGGVLGEEVTEVSGQAAYEIGEEVICFLVRNGQGEAVSIGLGQGKFHIWKDERTGEALARNVIHGLRPDSAAGAAPGHSRIIHRLTLAELRRRTLGVGQ